MSTSEVFKEFYSKLVKTLPMNDAIFIAELYSRDLLSDDLKEHIELLTTEGRKVMYFLDHVIKPSVTSDGVSSFDKLLNPLTVRFSDANVHMCRKRILQTNHTIYTNKTIY